MRATTAFRSVAIVAATFAARPAFAQTADVEAEHQRGLQLRSRGRDAEAAEVFRGLFERTGEPRALARLGLAEGALLRWVDAEEHLQGALARTGDAWVTANRAGLEGGLRTVQQHLGRVSVTCATPGASVQWSGQAPLSLPLARPLRVPAGFLDLVVHAPGYAPVSRRVAVTAGTEPVTVDVTLTREPAESAAVAATAPVAPRVAPTTLASVPPSVRPTPVDAPPAGRTWLRPLGIGLVAGAGVSLGVGVLGVVLREGAASRFNGANCRLYPDRDEVSSGPASCADDLAASQTAQTMSVAGFVTAGVLGVAGVTALLLAPRSAPAVRAAVAPVPGGWAGSVTLRF